MEPQLIFPSLQTADDSRTYKLDLKLGFRCNNHCTFCVQGDKREYVGDLTTEEAKHQLTVSRADCDRVVLTGGEITVRNDLPEIVAHARDVGYRLIQIQTNGRRLAYRSYCQALIDAGANEFNPALHGHTAALHDALVGAPGAFDQCTRGMRNLRDLGQRVLTQTVLTRSNTPYLLHIARLLVELGAWQVQFAFVHAIGSAEKNWDTTVPRYRDVARYLPAALDYVRRAGRSTITEAVPFCFLQGREWAAIEPVLPQTTVHDGDIVIGDYERYRREAGKLQGPPCEACTWKARCEGPWKEYPERFGWEEFTPRTDPP